MKKALTVLILCIVPVIFLTSCKKPEDNTISTAAETSTTEKTYKTSGKYSENTNWKYDPSTSTIYLYGTGKIGVYCWDNDQESKSKWFHEAENIYIEEGITDAGEYTFSSCDKARTLTLPASYTGVLLKVDNAEKYIVAENNPIYSSDEHGVLFNRDKTEIIRFPQNSPLETYKIPEGVTNIYGAFDGSKNLKTVIIPESLENISMSSFEESSIYTNPLNWDEDVFYVDDCLVKVDWKTKAEHITVRDGTRRIEAHAFACCESVKSITIPDSVEIIGAQAFESCSSLEKIYIGSGVKKIGVAPFIFDVEGRPCINLKSIEVSKSNKHYVSVDGVLFNKEMTELIQYPIGKKQKEYVIPDSVTTLGYGAFCFCDELTKLTVGKGVTVIDDCMLFGCDNIETVILPDTLTKLDGGAFKYSGIKYIDIPDSVTFLGCEAMTACERLETVNIGKGVSFIHECAIGGSSLRRINVDLRNKHFSSKDGVLFNKDKTELLLYPANKSGETYRIPSSVKVIKLGAINQAKNLQKIYVGSGIEKIEEANFCHDIEAYDGYVSVTDYEIYYDGTEMQWNKLFVNEYERAQIDKTKIHFS